MQYKTVTVKHKDAYKKKELLSAGDKYQNIINQHAACGWILLGIHTMPLMQKVLVFWAKHSQVDILIFFREDGAPGLVEPNVPESKQRTGAPAGFTQNAMNFMNPQQLAGKFGDLKNKAVSSVSGLVNNSNGNNNSNTPQE